MQYIVGILYLARYLTMVIAFGERLTPDTSEYAHGSACWSSVVSCSAGAIGGLRLLEIVSGVATFLVGIMVTQLVGWKWSIAVALLPPGWYLMQPSADAVGFLASLVYWRRNGNNNGWKIRGLFLVGLAHLVCALVLVCVLAFRWILVHWKTRLLPKLPPALYVCANSGRLVTYSAFLASALACLGQLHWQTRYFLPAVAVAVAQ